MCLAPDEKERKFKLQQQIRTAKKIVKVQINVKSDKLPVDTLDLRRVTVEKTHTFFAFICYEKKDTKRKKNRKNNEIIILQ